MNKSLSISDTQDGKCLNRVLPIAGALGVLGCLVGVIGFPQEFWAGYLVSSVYWIGASLACLGITLIHTMTGGRWGRMGGRGLHAGLAVLPVGILACFVMGIGASQIFAWAGTDEQRSILTDTQKSFLTLQAVGGRLFVFGLIWLAMVSWLLNGYRRRLHAPERRNSARMAALCIMVFFVTVSLFTVDSMMSLTPGWASSLYSLIRILGFAVTAIAIVIIAQCATVNNPDQVQKNAIHDLGNLMQAFNLLWTYLSFSQYLIIWGGDLVAEVRWYTDRRESIWLFTSYLLFFMHFLVPFLLLLQRDLKQNPKRLSRVAKLLLVMCLVDTAWVILPSIPGSTGCQILFTISSWLVIGSIWAYFYQRQFDQLHQLEVIPAHGGNGHGHHATAQTVGEQA